MFRFSVAFINNFIVVCLIWFIVLMVLYYTGEALYNNNEPIKSVDGVAQGAIIKAGNNPAVKNQDNVEGLVMRLNLGNLERGQRLFSQCALCHTVAANAQNRIGPNLWGIIERPVGSLNNFHYSTALRTLEQRGVKWNYATLDAFLKAPQFAVKGTIMTYKGMNDAQDRADLLLYLRSLSDNLQDLPKAEDKHN